MENVSDFNAFTSELANASGTTLEPIVEEQSEDLLEKWDDVLLPSAPKMVVGEKECNAMGRLLMRAPRDGETIRKIEEEYGVNKDINFLPPGLPIFLYTKLTKLPLRNGTEKKLKEIQVNLLQGLALVSKDLSQIKENKQFLAGIYRLCNANALINEMRRENTLEALNVSSNTKIYAPKHPLFDNEKVTLGEHSYINLFPNSLKSLLKDKYDPQAESFEALVSKSRKRSYPPTNKERNGYVYLIQNCLDKWSEITSDPYILKIVREGVSLGFVKPPSAQTSPTTYALKIEDELALGELILSLHERKIIQEVDKESLKWCNPIFNVPKKNHLPRLIVDLSPLNEYLTVEHFKLEDINSAMDLSSRGCFFISLDLKDAYYSIGVKEEESYFLGITSREKFYKFNSLAFGISTAPKIFTRVTKPIVIFLRRQGWRICRYLDDFLIVTSDYLDGCRKSSYITQLLTDLGFLVNKEKSVLTPQPKILHLGFWLTNDGTLYVPDDKLNNLLDLTENLLTTRRIKCRTLAKYLGFCTSCCRGIKNLSIYLRNLQQQLSHSLNGTNNYNRFLQLSEESREDLLYIKENVKADNGINFLIDDTASTIIFTDASLEGWGAVSNDICIKGTFSEDYIDEIIAIKEMLAIEYATAFFIKDNDNINSTENTCFTIKSDSLVSIYLLKRGGTTKGPRSALFNKIIKDILHNIGEHKVSFDHISGTLNTEADYLSREMIKKEEVSVGKEKRIFLKTLILQKFEILKTHYNEGIDINELFDSYFIDLFASNANKMCCDFFSLYPQPHMMGMNSFRFHWHGREKFYYIFPPPNMILKTLNKLVRDQKKFGCYKFVILLPFWEGCIWYPICIQSHQSFIQSWSLHSLRGELERDLSVEAATTILSGWSDNTKKVYSSACSIWLSFCKSQQREVSNISISQLTDFILYLKNNYSISSVHTIVAGITSLLQLSGRSLSEREKELVQRTLKGSTRLSLLSAPKKIDNTIWNLGEFLETIKNLPDTDDPMFYAQKAATLLMIVSPQRVSELATLKVSNIQFFDSHTMFHITVPTKTKPRGFNFRIDNFPEDEVLCPIATLKRYMTLTNDRRIDDSLFVTIRGTKKQVTTSTIQRWIKLFLLKGNVDACAHSIRKSSSSWLFQKGITAEKIKSLCNWSKQGSTWEKFYYKDIAETNVLETLKL